MRSFALLLCALACIAIAPVAAGQNTPATPAKPASAAPAADAIPPAEAAEAATGRSLAETAAVVGGGAAVSIAALWAIKLTILPLFSRLRRSKLLDNPVRARIYEHIRREPGTHLAEVVDFSGLSRKPVKHHVDQLVRHGFVTRIDVEGRSCYFAAGEVPLEVARRSAVLRSQPARELYEVLEAAPGITLRDAAAKLGRSPATIYVTRRKLQKAGLIGVKPASATVRVSR